MPNLRHHILKLIMPITEWFGRIHMPFSVKRLSGTDYSIVKSVLKPGDIILSHTNGSASNVIIPGYWKHVGMIINEDSVIEATGKGVMASSLIDFVMKKDAVQVLSPLFAEGSPLFTTDEIKRRAVEIALSLIGSPYDYLLEYSLGSNRAFYCAEVIWYSYEMAMKEFGAESPFTPRLALGVQTITPQDFSNAKEKWKSLVTLPMD